MTQYTITRYLINAPGRVGGHIVKGIIRSAGKPVLHTHDPWYQTDDDSITCLILLDRRDVFAAVMSNAITWNSGQSTNYQRKTIEPFELSEQDFVDLYRAHIWHRDSVNLSRPWGNVVILYFEDFVNNHEHVLKTLGLQQNPELSRSPIIQHLIENRAPYNYRDVIRNHEQLLDAFERIQQQDHPNPLRPQEHNTTLKAREIFE